MVTIAMSMISGKLGEDKQNKQEKSETAVRESIGVVPLALPLMAGRGRSVLPSSGVRVITALVICLVSLWLLHCSLYVAGDCSAWHRGWYEFYARPAST